MKNLFGKETYHVYYIDYRYGLRIYGNEFIEIPYFVFMRIRLFGASLKYLDKIVSKYA